MNLKQRGPGLRLICFKGTNKRWDWNELKWGVLRDAACTLLLGPLGEGGGGGGAACRCTQCVFKTRFMSSLYVDSNYCRRFSPPRRRWHGVFHVGVAEMKAALPSIQSLFISVSYCVELFDPDAVACTIFNWSCLRCCLSESLFREELVGAASHWRGI